jgi:16S rRNA (cytidine1402-2'-O)-methyltransferase
MPATVYLIPTVLEEQALHTLPLYILPTVKNCQVIFAENERTARRFLKQLDKTIVIDNFEWHSIHKAEDAQKLNFKAALLAEKNIAIISEAGCPGIADPGQILVELAQQMKAIVKPLVGPSSILLALMASGMNGQQFTFNGYLPVDNAERNKAIAELEIISVKKNCTQIFIETPYRNDQLVTSLLKVLKPNTRLCIAMNLTSSEEWIQTKTVKEWGSQTIVLHKKPTIFLIQG